MPSPAPASPVVIQQTGQMLAITLNRPQAINSLNLEMVRLLQAALNIARQETRIHFIRLCLGGPSSTITPSSMNTTRSPTSRAKPISCVTTTMVMPSRGELAHHVEHVADQLRVERRRRLVEQHQLRLHRERPRDRDPLLLAAGQLRRVAASLSPSPTRSSSSIASLDAPPSGLFFTRHRRLDHVLEAVMCGNRLKRWKTMPILARSRQTSVAQLVELVARPAVADELAVDPEPAGVDLLQVVDAAQERRLARAGGPDEAHHLARRDLEVDALQHLEPAEALAHRLGLDHRLAHRARAAPLVAERAAGCAAAAGAASGLARATCRASGARGSTGRSRASSSRQVPDAGHDQQRHRPVVAV